MMAALQQTPPGRELRSLFAGLADETQLPQLHVTGLSLDSRTLKPGDLFLACAGTAAHGAHYIEQAIANGAVAVALEPAAEIEGLVAGDFPVPVFRVEGLQQLASEVAGRFYGQPSERLKVVGITGTNGKTSVSQFIAQAISRDATCGVIGTLGSGLHGRLESTGHTTPDAVSLQRQLAQMLEAGATHVAMEVSSHALDQGRVNGVRFAVAVYTNLTHEHLDYHRDMAGYAEAKRRLLQMPGLRQAVINIDDAVGRSWLKNMPEGLELVRYGLESADGELFADQLQLDADGLSMRVVAGSAEAQLKTGLLGRFNAANLLAALGALMALGYDFGEAVGRLAEVNTVAGRMEAFGGGERPLVVVDYAHTPDALENVLHALREHTAHQLWCIFGCGGERDRKKRPLMGRIAEALADHVVITDDNPRGEDPFSIIEDILGGIQNPDAVYICRDRRMAIADAIGMARDGDVILVAGKGHETEQQIGDEKIPFSDRQEVAALMGGEAEHG